jgi:hypothetical protein
MSTSGMLMPIPKATVEIRTCTFPSGLVNSVRILSLLSPSVFAWNISILRFSSEGVPTKKLSSTEEISHM